MENLGAGELILLSIILLPVILFLIAIIDILRSEFHDSNKVVWVLVVFFLPILGPILYFIIGRKQKKPKLISAA